MKRIARLRWMARIRVFAAGLLVLGGCGTSQISGREQFTELPLGVQATHANLKFSLTTPQRVELSESAAAVGSSHPEVRLDRFIVQVTRVVKKLQLAAQRVYPRLASGAVSATTSGATDVFEVFVVNSGVLGSSSSANGKIALNAGLERLDATDEVVAFVAAREMGHVIARHSEESSTNSLATSIIMNLLVPGSGLLKMTSSIIGSQFAADSNRDQKRREADAIALALLAEAGYDSSETARGLASVLGTVAIAGRGTNSWTDDLTSSANWMLENPRGFKTYGAMVPEVARQANNATSQTGEQAPSAQSIWMLESVSADSLAATHTQDARRSGDATSGQAVVPLMQGLPALTGSFVSAIRIR